MALYRKAYHKAYSHGNDEWFQDLKQLVGSGPTPQEKLKNIIRAFEICRVRSVRLPVPSSGLAFMRECPQTRFPREGRHVAPEHVPAQASSQT